MLTGLRGWGQCPEAGSRWLSAALPLHTAEYHKLLPYV